MKRSNALAWLGVAGLAGLLITTGCAGYKLGSNLPEGITSIAIPTFVNDTREPGLESTLTSAAIKEFQKDGSLRVLVRDEASCVMEVVIRKYELEPLRYQRNKNLTAQEYRLNITAEVVVRRLPSQEILVDHQRVVGFTTFTALTDLPSARRLALPKAADDLGQRLVKLVVEYW